MRLEQISKILAESVRWKRRISSHTNVLKRTKSRINSRLQLLVTQQVPKYFAPFQNSPLNCAKYRGGYVILVDAWARGRNGREKQSGRYSEYYCGVYVGPPADSFSPTDVFSGGLEMLFNNENKHEIQIPATSKDDAPVNVAYLVQYLCDNIMKDTRKELFVLGGSM
jgi:hypothetical protein